MRAIPIISFLVIVLSLAGSPAVCQDSAAVYAQMALEYFERGKRDSAVVLARRGIQLDSNDAVNTGLSEYVIGASQSLRYRFDQARPHLLRAIQLLEQHDDYPEELGDAYLKAGGCFKDPTTRIAFYDKAIEQFLIAGDSIQLAATYLDMGIVHYRQGNLEQFRKLNQEGLSHLTGTGPGGVSARLKFGMGRYFNAIGNTDAGILYMKEALDETLEIAPNDPFLFNVCREYGQLLAEAGRYADAVRVYRIPLLPDSVYKSSHRLLAEADMWLDVGIAFSGMNDRDSAELAFVKASKSLATYGEDHVFAAYPLAALAHLHLQSGRTEEARLTLSEAIQIVEADQTYRHPDYAMMSLKMAMTMRDLGRPQEALNRADSGLVALGYRFQEPFDFSDIYRYDLTADLLNFKSNLIALHPQFEPLRTDHYHTHMSFLDSLQSKSMDPSTRINIIQDNYSVYELAINHAFSEFESSSDPVHVYEAFTISERSKDQLFKQFLLKNRLRQEVDLDPSYLVREKALNDKLIDLRLQMISLNESDSLYSVLEEERTKLTVEILELQHKMNDPYDGSAMLTNDASTVIRNYRSKMNMDQVVLHFFDGSESDYLFVMTQNGLSGFVVACDAELEEFIENVSNPGAGSDWTKTSDDLYAQIESAFEFIPPSVSHVTIVPDGKWAKVPFEALVTSEGLGDANYLIERYAISYGNSIRSLETEYGSGEASKFLSAWAPEYPPIDLATADSTGSELYADLVRSGEYALPGAKREAKTIANISGGKTFIGRKASEREFRANAHKFRVLHLSMHALLEDRDPNFSRLLFTLTDDPVNDDFLYASELSILELNAELAVLSACNTGSGKNIKGEGVMSLSRAFHYAGVPSVVHSLWKVPDDATADIMTWFYEQLESGSNKAEALREAKLRYLRGVFADEEAHPYYWAGFVANGDISPVEDDKKQWTHYVLLLLAAVVVILVVSRRKLNL